MTGQVEVATQKPSLIKRYFSHSKEYVENIVGRSLTDEELAKFKSVLNGKITKNPRKIRIRNTLTDKYVETDVYKLINLLCTTNHILSGYGMIFDYNKRHDNYAGTLLSTILKMRKTAKHEMFNHINDVIRDMYEMLNMRQLTLKLIANSWFGAAGQSSFFCFDINIGASITYTGYVLISSIMLALETFIGNSLNFYKERDIFTFLNNCQNDFKRNDRYDIKEFLPDDFNELYPLDENNSYRTAITNYIMDKIDISVTHKLKTEGMYNKVYERLSSFTEDQLIRIVFKRNLTYFSSSKKFCEIAASAFDPKFVDPMKCTDINKDIMGNLMDVIDNFVSYYYCYTDRYEVIHKIKRKTVLVVDTDSVFMRLKDVYDNINRNINKEVLTNDDKHNTIVLCNIVTNIANRYIRNTLDVIGENMNVPEEYRNDINMKSEFLFSRILLTKNKKSYGGVCILNEGKILLKPKLDMKGLQIKKVGCPRTTRDFFSGVFENDILNAPKIEIGGVLSKINDFSKFIYSSINEENKALFSTPSEYTSVKAYDEPYRIQSVRGVLLWNYLYPEQQIADFEKVNLFKLNGETPEKVLALLSDNIEFANEIIDYIFNHEYLKEYGANVIAIPKGLNYFPAELSPLINIEDQVTSNLNSFVPVLEALGVASYQSTKSSSKTSTNIISV